jgi:hypothetical protein
MVTPVELRCPHCGARLTAFTPFPWTTSYARCPHCASVLPFVAPRDPPPLYSWEVHPGLYPSTPFPRRTSPWRGPTLLALLVAVTALLLTLGGAYALLGSEALGPGSVTIGGQVRANSPAAIWVEIQGENGFTRNLTTVNGTFSIPNVPYGGVSLHAGAVGFAILEVDLFVSPVYTSVSGSPAQLSLSLTPANGSSITIVSTTEFPDLESFVASLLSATGLLWIAAAVSGLGIRAALQGGRLSGVVVGGCSAIAAPFVLPVLGIDIVNEALTAVAVVAIPVGVVILLLSLPDLARAQGPVEPI